MYNRRKSKVGSRRGGWKGAAPETKEHSAAYAGVLAVAPTTDWAGSSLNPDSTHTLNAIPQGPGATERIGRRVNQHALYLKGHIALPTSATTLDLANLQALQPFQVKLIVVLDRFTNSTLLDPTQLYDASTTQHLGVEQFRNRSEKKRFRILYKKVFTVKHSQIMLTDHDGGNDRFYATGAQVPFEIMIPLKGLKTTFTTANTTGVIGGLTDNSIHIHANANGPLVGGAGAYASFRCKVYYNSRILFSG